jgi:hypothetical protein
VRTPEIPPFYWELITACWYRAPHPRPSFIEILEHLRADRSSVLPDNRVAEVEEYEERVTKGVGASAHARTVDGRRVDPDACEKLRKIGMGARSEVTLGSEQATGRRVLLKWMFIEGDDESKVFKREVEIMFAMTHPATLSLLGWAPSSPAAYRA